MPTNLRRAGAEGESISTSWFDASFNFGEAAPAFSRQVPSEGEIASDYPASGALLTGSMVAGGGVDRSASLEENHANYGPVLTSVPGFREVWAETPFLITIIVSNASETASTPFAATPGFEHAPIAPADDGVSRRVAAANAPAVVISRQDDDNQPSKAGPGEGTPSLMTSTNTYSIAFTIPSVPIDAAALSADQVSSVSFISGLTANGTIAATAFWTWNGSNPAGYSAASGDYKWQGGAAGTAGGTVYYYFTPSSDWTVAEETAFASGLALWSAVANIQFVQTTNAAAAMLIFSRDVTPGEAYTDPTSISGTATVGNSTIPRLNTVLVSIDTSVYGWTNLGSFTVAGGYGVDTVVHEEGHVLGLGHAGPYNGNVDPATQQYDTLDTRLWSIMSYIEPGATTAKFYNSYPVTGTEWSGEDPTTWMPLDILAAQRIYGPAVGGPLSGGQIFGFNSNIASSINAFFNFSVNTRPVVTLYDSGRGNSLDLSGFATASTVNLNPGTFSSTDGMTNDIGIAFSTAIDTFVGGPGNDSIIANDDGDTINGGGGTNTVLFAGTESQYRIDRSTPSLITVADTVANRNGVDNLTNISYLQFTDKTLTVSDLETITFSEYPIYTINPDYSFPDNTVDVIGEIVSDGAQPNSPAVAANTDYYGPVYAYFLDPVIHVEFDAGYFDDLGSTTIDIFGPGGSVLSSATNSALGIVHYVFDFASGISAIEINNTGNDLNGFSADTISFSGSFAPVAATSTLAIAPLSAVKAAGQSGTTPYTFTVTRTGNTAAAVSALYSVTGSGTDPVTPSDAPGGVLLSGTVNFAAGQTSQVITVNFLGSTTVFTNQTFTVTLLAPSVGTSIATATATGTVLDDNDLKPAKPDDLNGDGKSDIVLQANSGAAVVYSMNGGTVTAGTSLGNFGAATQIVDTGDFNADGTADVLLEGPNCSLTVSLVQNDAYTAGFSLGTFGAAWSVVGTGDFNGDSRSDILLENTGGALVCYSMNGGSIIGGTSLGSFGGGRVVGIGDFNGDGTSDLLVQSATGALVEFTVQNDSLVAGYDLGTFAGFRVAGVGDYNGDGDSDILLQNNTTGAAVIFSMNGGSVINGTSLGTLGGAQIVATGDYNGNGTSDILVQSLSGALTEFTIVNDAITAGYSVGNPGVAWHAITPELPGSVASLAKPNDLNGDGKSDIVLQSTTGSAVVYDMNGGSIVTATSLGTFSAGTQIVGTGDFNGDGTSDVLVEGANCTLSIFTVQNDAYVGSYGLGTFGASWSVAGTGDFNGDGKSDILLQNTNGAVICFNMNGGATIGSASLGNFSAGTQVVGIGDFNGDGSSDFLVQSATGALTDFTVQSDALAAGYNLGTFAGFRVAGVGDYNGDGKSDILLQNTSTNAAVILSMNGGSISNETSLGTLGGSEVVATGDYNGDGTSDILLQNPNGALTEFTITNDTLTAGYSLGNPGIAWHAVTPELPGTVINASALGLSAAPDTFLAAAAAPAAPSSLADSLAQAVAQLNGLTQPTVAPAAGATLDPTQTDMAGGSSLSALLTSTNTTQLVLPAQTNVLGHSSG